MQGSGHAIFCVEHRPDHAGGVGERGEDEDERHDGEIGAFAEAADARARRVAGKLLARDDGDDADIVVRAGVNAVEAEGAIHVAGLHGLEQIELTAGEVAATEEAILGGAGVADVRGTNANLEGGGERLDEVELADGANVFAEGDAAGERVDGERSEEIGDGDQRGQARALPESERFVRPEEEEDEEDGQPLALEGAGPGVLGGEEELGEAVQEHEGTAQAEEIANEEQGEYEQSAPVNPGEDTGEIERGHLGAEESVGDDEHGQEGQGNL